LTKPMAAVQAEFDQIARTSGAEGGWDHNNHYHADLLKQLPTRMGSALEIGCGTGEFARLLAARADHVFGVDLSAAMLRIAAERSTAFPNITYQQADVLDWDWPVAQYDCIASIATLHHLPLETVLTHIKTALKPGGVLLILDIYQYEVLADSLRGAVAIPVNLAYQRLRNGGVQHSAESRAAWEAHGEDDVYPRVSEVRRIATTVLPGVQVRKHLLWRYSLVWRK
jgi:SAM-dependent methyltransferase